MEFAFALLDSLAGMTPANQERAVEFLEGLVEAQGQSPEAAREYLAQAKVRLGVEGRAS